ncbi:hypothetical protein QTN25_006107 [Entamoeba marina]
MLPSLDSQLIQFDNTHLNNVQNLIDASLTVQLQGKVMELLPIVRQYDDYINYLIYLLPKQSNPPQVTMVCLLIKQAVEYGSNVDYVSLTKVMVQLLSFDNQQVQKASINVLTTCFPTSPLSSQLILQSIFEGLQTQSNTFISTCLELLSIVITDHFYTLNKSFYPLLKQILDISLHLFPTATNSLKTIILLTFNQILVAQNTFLKILLVLFF